MMRSEIDFFDNLRKAIATGTDHNRAKQAHTYNSKSCHLAKSLDSIANRSIKEQTGLVQEFLLNAQPLNIKASVVQSLEEASLGVIDLIRSKEPEFSHNKHIILHDHPDLEAMQLWKKFNREAVTIHTSFDSDSQVRQKTVVSFIGITAPELGIAESATLVEFGQPGRPRSTSLVPSIHIAIVKRENLVSTLEEGYAELKKRSPLEDVIFITGPSKTADIEAQLVHGAHGPKELHVFIVSPQEND